MSTTQELLAANERYEALRAAIEALADLWADADPDREFILGEHYADDLRVVLRDRT